MVFKIGGSYLTSGTYDFGGGLGVDGSGQVLIITGLAMPIMLLLLKAQVMIPNGSANFEFSIYN